MASIPDVHTKPPPPPPSNDLITEKPQEQEQKSEPQTTIGTVAQDMPSIPQANENEIENVAIAKDEQDNNTVNGVKASDDTRYRKYFKMLQFGVPAPAVKLKMANEGFDPNVLE